MELIRREKAINLPNLLTLARIALLPVVVLCFRKGDSQGALVMYTLSMATDVADGFIARRFDQITHLGRLLDPVADKLALLTLLWLFVSDGQIPVWVFSAVLIKELILISGSAFALVYGVVVAALPVGKAATFAFALSMALRLGEMRPAADALLWLSLLLSAAALIWYCAVLGAKLIPNNAKSTK